MQGLIFLVNMGVGVKLEKGGAKCMMFDGVCRQGPGRNVGLAPILAPISANGLCRSLF